MIFNTKATQKNNSQKLAHISLNKDKSNELWSELDETSQAAVSGGINSLEFGTLVLGAKILMPATPSLLKTLFTEVKPGD